MSESPTHAPSGSIIFIDRDICIRQMMEMMLSDQFRIVTAGSAEEGMALVEAQGPFEIVISGFVLPGMNGIEFLRRVGEKYLETVRILMTGGAPNRYELNRAISAGHISRLVSKPFCLSTLRDQLESDLAALICGGTTTARLRRPHSVPGGFPPAICSDNGSREDPHERRIPQVLEQQP